MRYLIFFILLLSVVDAQTLYYGQVLVKDMPIVDLQINAHFINQENQYEVVGTTTLTVDEAKKRSSSVYTGFYFFEPGQIDAKSNTKIAFTFGNYPYSIIISPSTEKNYRLNTISFDYENSGSAVQSNTTNSREVKEYDPIHIKELISAGEINNSINEDNKEDLENKNILEPIDEVNNDSLKTIEIAQKEGKAINKGNKELGNNAKEIIFIVVLIIILIFLVYLLTSLVKNSIGYISNVISAVAPTSSIKKILKSQIKNFATEIESLNEENILYDAAQYLINNPTVFVIENSYKGFINAMDIYECKSQLTKIKDFSYSKEKLIIDSKKSVADSLRFMISRHATQVCISEKESIIGKVSLIDILGVLRVSKQNLGYIPTIRENLERRFTIGKKNQTTKEVLWDMKINKSMVSIIKDDEKIIGIFTQHEFLSGYIKYSEKTNEQFVESLMLTNPPIIDPESDIIDAIKIFIEKGMLDIPVIVHDEVIGILSAGKIADALLNYFE